MEMVGLRYREVRIRVVLGSRVDVERLVDGPVGLEADLRRFR